MEMNGNSREAVFQEIISLADAMADRLTARRRDFHKYAETGWFEMRTSSLIFLNHLVVFAHILHPILPDSYI